MVWRRDITTKWITLPLIVLLFIFTVEELDAQVQSMPNSTPSYLVNQSHASSVMKILGIDPIAFPKVKVNVLINKSCAMAGNLKKENFKVSEDDTDAAIDNFYFTGNASGQKLDLAIVFDDTGSMQPEIDAMKSKVNDLTDTIKASGLDANYSLVSFKDSVSVKTKWTKDQAVLKKNVDSLYAEGGGDEPEDSMDAIEAVLSMGFRPDAQKVILVITDAHTHYKNDSSGFSKYTEEEVEKDLKDSGAIFIPISPTFTGSNGPAINAHVDLKNIANDLRSMWIDMGSADFSAILEQFKGILTGTYVIEYTSPNQNSVGNRAVTVTVNAPGCVVDTASSSYNRPRAITSHGTGNITSAWLIKTDPSGNEAWNKTFIDRFFFGITAYSVQQTSDGGYILSGGNPTSDGIWLIKTDPSGNEAWIKTFNGTAPLTDSVQQTSDGGYIIAGQNHDYASSALLIKTDANGNKLWDRTFGRRVKDYLHDKADSVQQTSDGGYIISGFTTSYGAGKRDAWLIKTDSSGNEAWNKTFGGSGNDEARSVQQTSDGGYIIAGQADEWSGGGIGGEDAWLIKTDPSGNREWDKKFKGLVYFDSINAYSVQQTSDGGYIIAGYNETFGSPTGFSAWLIKTDANGNKLWEKAYDELGLYEALSLQQTSDGGYIISGWVEMYNSDNMHAWLLKTDSSGNKQWEKVFVGSSYGRAYSVRQTNDGGYIIAGVTTRFYGPEHKL